MKELFLNNKKKFAAGIITVLTGLGIAINPELGLLIADGLEFLEDIIRGISVE